MSKQILQFNAVWVAYAHTLFALSAFISALIVGCWLHYLKIVQNGYYGYPDEWFPSVSATIGDRFPERSLFQVLILLTAGPRFALLLLCYIRLYKQGSILNNLALISGVIRTFTCGGWVYITSTDDHDFHDIFMISYIVLTIPWTVAIVLLTEKGSNLRRYRKYTSLAFFGSLVPLVYLFIQHKVHRVPGAYSYYAYVEWGLIFMDVGFDSWTIVDFKDLSIQISAAENGSITFESSKNVESASASTKTLIFKDTSSFSYFQLVINTINSFILFSTITALFVCIWHFPLWYMGISGYEAVILAILSPIILTVPTVRKLFAARPFIPRLVSVVCAIGSYKIEDPANRLLTISVGTFLAVASFANEVSSMKANSKDNEALKYYSATFGAGLLLSSVSKYLFWTNNPIWPIMHAENGGLNEVGLVVGVIAAYFTPKPSIPAPTSDNSKPTNSLFLTCCGIGGLMFSITAMLTDSTTIILWCWDGYPVTGPMPVPHGLITFVAMAFGIYLGFQKISLVSSWRFYFVGALGATVLYLFDGWLGYAGGLVYTVFLLAMVPVIFISTTPFQPGLVFFLGFLFNMLLTLAHVWVVAYAFVPGGFLLRERSDLVLGSSTLLIAGGVLSYRQLKAHRFDNLDSGSEKSSSIKDKPVSLVSGAKILRLLTVILALASVITFNRFNLEEPQPYHADVGLITAGIWTIHFGLDNDMWASEHRMRDLIRDAELDIVGLLESDNQRLIMGNRDVTQFLAEELGMYADYGPGPNKHTWGCALLSKFPILNSTHHLLPSPVGELAPAIHATLDVYGTLVDVVVFHSGQEEDVEDRRLQSLKLAEIMGSSDRPMILLSYLVTTPLEGNYNTYVSETSGMHDIDPSDWDRWCEYILFKKLRRTGYARISRSTITDTELQVGKFVIPQHAEGEEEEESLYTNTEIPEEELPQELRFPEKFYGDGIRGHKFHVLDDKPRYYS